MFPVFPPSPPPEPVVANGSIAIRSPTSSTSSPWSPTFGTDFPAWTVYRSIECPGRFVTGLYPKDSIVRSIVAPSTRVGSLGRTTSIAAASACSGARISSVQFRVPISTVFAVSVRYPSTCAPRSIFTTSPFWRTRASRCVGVSCAATWLTDRHVGKAGGQPFPRRNSSIRSTPSRRAIPSRRIDAPYSRPSRATFPARRSFSRTASDKSKVSRRNRPFPYNSWLRSRAVDDGRLLPERAGTRVYVEIHGLPELFLRFRELDRWRLAVEVRARGGDRPDADCDRTLGGDDEWGRLGGGAEQERERPWKPPPRERLHWRWDHRQRLGGIEVGEDDGDGRPLRAPPRREHATYSVLAERIG